MVIEPMPQGRNPFIDSGDASDNPGLERTQPGLKRCNCMQLWHPKPLALLHGLAQDRFPSIGFQFGLGHAAIALQGLNPVHAQFAGHPHHVVDSSANQCNGKTQLDAITPIGLGGFSGQLESVWFS